MAWQRRSVAARRWHTLPLLLASLAAEPGVADVVCIDDSRVADVPTAAAVFAHSVLERHGSANVFVRRGSGNDACPANGAVAPGVVTIALVSPALDKADVMTLCRGTTTCVVVGDTACDFDSITRGQFAFRQYGSTQYPYAGLPLGPRSTFEPVPQRQRLAGPRKFHFNFLGNVPGRVPAPAELLEVLRGQSFSEETEGSADESSMHPVRWKPTEPVDEAAYRATLLDSSFTLCPLGDAGDSYRFWEAVEAGSIPVVTRQDRRRGACPEPFPDVLATKPPVVLMESWDDLPIFMDALAVESEVAARRLRLDAWSNEWWTRIAQKVDSAVVRRHKYGQAHQHNSGKQPDDSKSQSKKERLAAIAAGYAMAKGKVVESKVKESYQTLLHMTGMDAPCMPPSAEVDATTYLASVADCVKMLLSPDAQSTTL